MKLRELPDVLHGRPRQCDELGGVVVESAAFFSSSAFQWGLRAQGQPEALGFLSSRLNEGGGLYGGFFCRLQRACTTLLVRHRDFSSTLIAFVVMIADLWTTRTPGRS